MGGVTTNDSLSSRVEEVTHLLMYVSTYIDRILFLAYTKTIDSVTSQIRLIMILLSEEIIKETLLLSKPHVVIGIALVLILS